MKKHAILFGGLIIALLIMGVACTKQSSEPATTSDAVKTIDDIGGSTPAPQLAVEYSVKKVKKAATPESSSFVSAGSPSNIDEFFAVLTCVVKGEITETTEYKVTGKQGNELVDSFYFTVLKVKVDKVYGNFKLRFSDDDCITVKYMQSTHDHIENISECKDGDECIFFLTDVRTDPPEYTDIDNSVFDYMTVYPEYCVCKKQGGKFAAQKFMSLFDGKDELYSSKKLEKVINENIDKIRNISLQDMIDELYGE